MQIYNGVDIVSVDRIKKSIERSGQTFLNTVFTKKEQEYCDSKGVHRFESYAARFAAKEAVSKAFGTGLCREAALLNIETINDERGKPIILLHNESLLYYNKMKYISICISLSHTDETAIAFVTIIGN